MSDESGVVSLEPEKLDYCFSGEFRLHTAADYSRVFTARRKLSGEYFDLHYLFYSDSFNPVRQNDQAKGFDRFKPLEKSIDLLSPRIGLVMAKKLARRAVLRNLLKRLAREAFRHARWKLPPCDLILRLARPPLRPQQSAAALRLLWRADVDSLLIRLAERGGREVYPRPPRNSSSRGQEDIKL